MDRLSSLPIVLVATGLVLAGVLTWAFWPSTPLAPAEQRAPGLADSATVTWVSQNVTLAEIQSAEDLEWTLGYVHGLRRTWSLLLWRQTATGHLSSWFGTGVAPLDRHVHKLGIPFQSKRAYAALPDSIRRRVRAYTRGVNAALSTPSAREHDELLALQHTPEPWMPWHTLAVEHLFSWLSTPDQPLPPALPGANAEGRVASFTQADSLLRSFLHVRGLDRSVAWSRRTENGSGDGSASFAARIVTGATAMPILHDVSFTLTGDAPETVVTGGTLPGSLVWLSGSHSQTTRTASASTANWAILPGHAPSLHRLPADSLTVHRRYARLTPRNADEQTIEIRQVDLPQTKREAPNTALSRGIPLSFASQPVDTLATDSVHSSATVLDPAVDTTASGTPPDTSAGIEPAPPSPQSVNPVAKDSIPVDSIWVLSWNGLRGRSDAATWTALTRAEMTSHVEHRGPAPAFSLHDGTGLLINEAASPQRLGPAPYVYETGEMIVVGRSVWTGPVAQSLTHHTDQRAFIDVRSDTSQWAAAFLRDALPNLKPLAADTGRVGDALTYLRNWEATYERSSIGASVFEVWLDTYARGDASRSTRPIRLMRMRLSPPLTSLADSLRPDTTFFAAHRQRRAFRHAIDRLTEEHGPDLRQWRWERVAPNRRFFPVWSSDSLIAEDLSELATTRYAPIDVPGRGHPSAPAGGPSLLSGVGDPYATAWTAWSEPGQQALVVRRSVFDVSDFLARPFLRRDETTDVALAPDSLTAPLDGDRSQFPVRTQLLPAER